MNRLHVCPKPVGTNRALGAAILQALAQKGVSTRLYHSFVLPTSDLDLFYGDEMLMENGRREAGIEAPTA